MTNEEIVRRYAQAMTEFDADTLESLRDPRWTSVWPQSGEIVPDSQSDREITRNYPGGRPRLLPEGRLVGSEDRWVTSPLGGLYRVAGDGDIWFGEWKMRYPDGTTWHTIILIELVDGKVFRETVYWAQPFDAPAWREAFVKRMGESI